MRVTVCCGLVGMLTCAAAVELGAGGQADSAFGERIVPDASFRFQGALTCEVLQATTPNFIGSRFTLHDADTKSVQRFWSRDDKGQRMPSTYEGPERVVFQSAGEDGSVDTLSIDKTNGTFARAWSGWTMESKELGAGGERGRCSSGGVPSRAR